MYIRLLNIPYSMTYMNVVHVSKDGKNARMLAHARGVVARVDGQVTPFPRPLPLVRSVKKRTKIIVSHIYNPLFIHAHINVIEPKL